MKGVGELLDISWKEYKENFKIIAQLFLYFYLIPSIAIIIIRTINPINENLPIEQNLITIISVAILTIITIFVVPCIIYMSLNKKKGKKMTYDEVLSGAKNYFSKYLILMILMVLLLIPLFLLLIIPGIIFAVYWTLASYILIKENLSPWESMKKSKKLITGSWWLTVGIALVLILISIVVSIPFVIPAGIYAILTNPELGAVLVSSKIVIIILDTIAVLSELIMVPLSTLVMKNYYLELIKKKK